jgi:ribosome biogenesis GTPase
MKLRKGSGRPHRSHFRRPGAREEGDAEDVLAPRERTRERQRSGNFGTIEELLDGDFGAFASGEQPSDAAIVISVASARCRVFQQGNEIDCIVPPEIATRQKSVLAVGDRVIVEPADGGTFRLAAILPRRSVLARPDPLNAHLQRLIAANVDLVVNVVSVKAPPLRPRLIDRFLIATQRGGAQPAICVNKIDLVAMDDRARELAPLDDYVEIGVPVIPCSVRTGEGIDALRATLQGKTCALVGHSGVGKSSVLNALDERLQIATGDLHEKRGTGRHTTTASTLHDLGDNTYVIDTPGIREFGLWDLTAEALREYFPEFDEPAELCRFNDCTHLHEPHCEVKERVETGAISRARYDTYVRLAEDLAQQSR